MPLTDYVTRRIADEIIEARWLVSDQSVAVIGNGAETVARRIWQLRADLKVAIVQTDNLLKPGVRYDVVIATDDLLHLSATDASAWFRRVSTAGRSVIAPVPRPHNLPAFDGAADANLIRATDRTTSDDSMVSVWDDESLAVAVNNTKVACGTTTATRLLTRFERQARPDVILWAPGHSATTQVVRMARRLGWCSPTADAEWQEPVAIRDHNEAALRSRGTAWDTGDAARLMHDFDAAAAAPWIIKEPRFCDLCRHWLPVWEPYRPTLVHLIRPTDAIQRSFARRQDREPDKTVCRGRYVSDVVADSDAFVSAWPWRKMVVSTGDLSAAAALWDADRVAR